MTLDTESRSVDVLRVTKSRFSQGTPSPGLGRGPKFSIELGRSVMRRPPPAWPVLDGDHGLPSGLPVVTVSGSTARPPRASRSPGSGGLWIVRCGAARECDCHQR